ncbi:MAG: helix-turn-helix transcriptional regulator [Bacillota bacterium]
MAFKDRLKEARTKKGISQEELAKMLGVTKGAVGNYEAGISFAKIDVLYKLFEILEVSPDFLFQDDIKKNVMQTSAQQEPTDETIELVNQLDEIDKAEIRGTVKQMLKAEKYHKKEVRHA